VYCIYIYINGRDKRTDGRKRINRRRLEGQRQVEEKDKIIVKWAQEDVETSNNLLNKI